MKIQKSFQSSHSGTSLEVVGIIYFDSLEEKLEFIENNKDIIHDDFLSDEDNFTEEELFNGDRDPVFEGHVVPVIVPKVEGHEVEGAIYYSNVAECGYTDAGSFSAPVGTYICLDD